MGRGLIGVVFFPRCGTTALMDWLSRCDGVFVDGGYPYEGVLASSLATLSDQIANGKQVHETCCKTIHWARWDIWPHHMLWLGRAKTFNEATVLQKLWEATADSPSFHGYRYIAEKLSPTHCVKYMRFNWARFIWPVRDPIDAAMSMVAFDRKRGFSGFGRYKEPESHFAELTVFGMLCTAKFLVNMIDKMRIEGNVKMINFSQLGHRETYEELSCWLDLPNCPPPPEKKEKHAAPLDESLLAIKSKVERAIDRMGLLGICRSFGKCEGFHSAKHVLASGQIPDWNSMPVWNNIMPNMPCPTCGRTMVKT